MSRLQLNPTALAVGDQILTVNANGVVTKRVLVKKLGLCPSHTKGIQRVHVNDSECYDDVTTLNVARGKDHGRSELSKPRR